jgi:hypothetical protein
MSTFYVLPSQALLGQRYAEFLAGLFPGMHWERHAWRSLAEALGEEIRLSDVYLVYREGMDDAAPLEESLVADFGAEPGDEVVEVALGGRLAVLTTRRWRIGETRRQAA